MNVIRAAFPIYSEEQYEYFAAEAKVLQKPCEVIPFQAAKDAILGKRKRYEDNIKKAQAKERNQ